jgi:hypothetical protein
VIARGQKTEDRRQRAGDRVLNSECGMRKEKKMTEGRGQMTEAGDFGFGISDFGLF